MSPTTILVLVMVLLVGLPVAILGAMLLAYEGEESRSRRVVDTLLFTPFALISFVLFAVMIGAIILDADWELGIESHLGSELLAYVLEWIVPVSVVASFLYLLITRPGDLKAHYPSKKRTIDAAGAVVDWVQEKLGVLTNDREDTDSFTVRDSSQEKDL